ncbi:UDP-N-acetylmuramoyl-L-alanine--D-glutamate ligase [Pendulispora albinea]|uniref:UDP-N-acetylmuramoylalanine--D-glutamate ligase n=1 Tax=Pendulispora albinea TaxID=2741071 RepID=A0ABZ2M439_9BACT
MLDLSGKHVAILGLGVSGCAAARLCLARGAGVTAFDAKSWEQLSDDARGLKTKGVRVLAGGHPSAALKHVDLVVTSPGFPSFPELESSGVRVIAEIELAVQALPPSIPIVAVGGTNGKSTTTSLIGALFEAHGKHPFVGGNFGEPVSDYVGHPFDVMVLEVSSFQLERLETFKPKVSILLNVTPDHLDRYPTFDDYAHTKGNAFERQTEGDLAVVPFDDAICEAQARRGKAPVTTFGPGGDVDVTPEAIVDRALGHTYARREMALVGSHNALNIAAAIAAVRPFGVPAEAIRSTLRTFRGLAHRTAFVADIHGVRVYDDSKGTNVGASVTALRGVPQEKVVLIAGGREKGGSYEPLISVLRTKGRGVVVLGEAAGTIARAVGSLLPIRRIATSPAEDADERLARTMDDVVRAAFELAQPGDAVLLSPACSSLDMFRDYKHRGEAFVSAVERFAKERP